MSVYKCILMHKVYNVYHFHYYIQLLNYSIIRAIYIQFKYIYSKFRFRSYWIYKYRLSINI